MQNILVCSLQLTDQASMTMQTTFTKVSSSTPKRNPVQTLDITCNDWPAPLLL